MDAPNKGPEFAFPYTNRKTDQAEYKYSLAIDRPINDRTIREPSSQFSRVAGFSK